MSCPSKNARDGTNNFQHIPIVPAFCVVTFNCIQIIFAGCNWLLGGAIFSFEEN